MENRDVFTQDLEKKDQPGAVFIIKLLFKEPVKLPEKERMLAVMEKHHGEVDCFWHDEKGAGFATKKYLAQFKDAAVPPQLMITDCTPFDGMEIDEFTKSQMWDCMQDRDRILRECRYQLFATDMLAAALTAKERADLDMDFLEALMELYPECEAVCFHNSGKMFSAGQVRNHKIPREDRFIYFGVNVRFFNIQNTNDMIVDTLGMSTLFLPDIQYHFHDMDPNWVVNHAYNIASYILSGHDPIENGDTIDGVENGKLSRSIQWKCHYEEALIQPAREVLDICMDQYASGIRS